MNLEKIKSKIQKLVNHYNVGNYTHVIKEAGILLRKIPDNLFLMNLIGSCFQKINQLQKAKRIFEDIIALDRQNVHALNNLANTLKTLKNYKLAEEKYTKAIEINPKFSQAFQNFANLKFDLNKHQEAISLYKKALECEPENYLTHYNLGLVYQSIGKFKDAEFHLKKVTKIEPKFTNGDKILSRFTKYKIDDSHIKDMENRLTNEKLDDFNKSNILFALGKAYEDINEFEKSFNSLEKGNSILKKLTNYNFKIDKHIFETQKKIFENMEKERRILNSNKKNYIFIVGLPRSGTSLVEQILSSHSEIYGAGELSHLGDAIKKELYINNKLINNFKERFNDLECHKKIGNLFNQNIESFSFDEKNMTDKNPLNFLWIGFIKIIFPKSKVIHIHRNPRDNYFSLFKNTFDGNMNWCYDKSDLLNYCLNYRDLMNFWNELFPDFILNVKYEDLISNTETEIRKMLSYCEVNWEKNCLDFYKTDRAIKTVSSAQARKPIYKSSIKSYENYSKFLGDYFDKL